MKKLITILLFMFILTWVGFAGFYIVIPSETWRAVEKTQAEGISDPDIIVMGAENEWGIVKWCSNKKILSTDNSPNACGAVVSDDKWIYNESNQEKELIVFSDTEKLNDNNFKLIVNTLEEVTDGIVSNISIERHQGPNVKILIADVKDINDLTQNIGIYSLTIEWVEQDINIAKTWFDYPVPNNVDTFKIILKYKHNAFEKIAEANITITPDVTPPTCNFNSLIKDIPNKAVTAYGDASDLSGIDNVEFPTWTEINGLDDIVIPWYKDVTADWNSNWAYWVRINMEPQHTWYKTSKVITHMYATDNVGNRAFCSNGVKEVLLDVTPPTCTAIHSIDQVNKILTVSVTSPDESGIAEVEFPTWSNANNQDDMVWYRNSTPDANPAYYSYSIPIGDHADYGTSNFTTHIYVTDNYDNRDAGACAEVIITPSEYMPPCTAGVTNHPACDTCVNGSTNPPTCDN